MKETFERILSLKDDLNDQWRNLIEEAKSPNLGIFSKLDLSKLEPDLNDFEEFEIEIVTRWPSDVTNSAHTYLSRSQIIRHKRSSTGNGSPFNEMNFILLIFTIVFLLQ